MQTRRCRALACPRHVAATVLFCDVHFRQLPPKYLKPIARNRDVPSRATINDAQAIVSATSAAIAYLSGKEGRKKDLKLAAAVAAGEPSVDTGGTGSGAVAQATGSGGSTGDAEQPTFGGNGRFDKRDGSRL